MPVNTGSGRSGKGATPPKTLNPLFSKNPLQIFFKISKFLRAATLYPRKTFGKSQEFFEVLRWQKVIFRLGAPVPQTGTLSSGSVGAFCSAHRGPTFCESRLEIFYTVSEIFRVKVFPFSPHSVTTEESSESPLRHMVEGVGGYNVLDFCRASLYAACPGGRRMFRPILQYGNSMHSNTRPYINIQLTKRKETESMIKLLHKSSVPTFVGFYGSSTDSIK